MHFNPRVSSRFAGAIAITALSAALIVVGVSRAHAARGVSPFKACSNGTSCFQIIQNGSGDGISSSSMAGNAVEAHATKGNGVYSDTKNPSSVTKRCAYGLVGVDLSTDGGTMNYGVSGRSYHGTGMFGESGSGPGIMGTSKSGTALMGMTNSATNPALAVQSTGASPIINALNAENTNVLQLDQQGNLTITGVLRSGGGCHTGCMQSSTGHGAHLVAYAPRESAPTMEDFGEAQLVNGSVTVRLSADFANAIDVTKGYLVFVTPEGDTKGLFVAMRTPAGFTVREVQGGRANVPFSYRIVAKPFGQDAPRLPIVRD